MDSSVHSNSPEARDIERALAEPAVAALLANGAPVYVVAGQPLTVVYANAAALGFFGGADAGALAARLLATPDQGARRLNELAVALRPDAPARLEKLRFTIGRRVESLTCLCRRVGEEGKLLVVGVLGVRAAPVTPPPVALAATPATTSFETAAPPADPPTAAPTQAIEEPAAATPEVATPEPPVETTATAATTAAAEPDAEAPTPTRLDPAAAETALMARFQNAPTVRFLWRSDAAARLVDITGQLCEVVGCDSAALIGRDFAGQARQSGADPTGKLAAAFERRETWSGLQLLWPIGGANAAVPISLGAVPSFDVNRVFDGFRGFGVIHIQRIEPFEAPTSEASPAPTKEHETPAAIDHEKAEQAVDHAEPPAIEPAHVEETDSAPVAETPVETRASSAQADNAATHETTEPATAELADPAMEPIATEPAPPASEPTPRALWNHVAPEPVEPPAPVEPEAPAIEPREAPRNVISLRDYRAFPPVLPEAPATARETPERPAAPIDIAGPSTPPPTNPPSRLVELTPAERKAFGDIARALGAKPIDEETRAKKLGASEDDAPTSSDAEPAPPGEEGPSHAPTAEAAGEPTIETNAAPAMAVEETNAPTVEPPVGFDEDEHDPLDHEGPASPAAEAAGAPTYDVMHVASAEPVAPAASAPAAALEHLETTAHPAKDHPADASASTDHPDVGLERNAARVLDRLPFGVLISRLETPIYLNRALLDLLGYASADLFHEAGGLDRMFHGRQAEDLTSAANGGSIPVVSASGDVIPVEGRLQSIEWDGAPATLMSFRKPSDMDLLPHVRSLEAELRQGETQNRELHAILDTATDGVAVLDQNGRILSLNRSAEALFGYEQNEVAGESFTSLLAPESHAAAMEYLAGLQANGVASLLNDGREAMGRARQGGLIPIFMTLGRLGATGQKFCAVLRDMTQWKKVERELRDARREAERSSQLKSDFLAKISHEIRTPLNAIIGFAEVIMEERFGPVGNERYKDYLKDIHASGGHVMSLVNDLLDLSKIEAGKLDLNFTAVDANRIVGECVSLIQPQATVDRVIVRTSLAPRLPKIVADERSLRQIMLNILSNAVKFNEPGGQVIVSTALTDSGHAVLRIKDTGIGMNEAEVQTALEPFRQIQTARAQGGTGLGLPLTKALVEANRASFTIRSKKNEGTLVEVSFPSTRVLAE